MCNGLLLHRDMQRQNQQEIRLLEEGENSQIVPAVNAGTTVYKAAVAGRWARPGSASKPGVTLNPLPVLVYSSALQVG